MDWLISALGAGLVLLGLRDIFHTLWHPTARKSLGRHLMRLIWRLSRRTGRRRHASTLAGPLAMVAVVCTWTSVIVLGWALIYWPHLPDGFVFAAGLDVGRRMDLLDALYLSLVTVATLGFGDIVPTAGWLRIAAPMQALIGFVLLTATVSWVLQIYPTLMRRRALAIKLSVLRRSDADGWLAHTDSPFAAVLLDDLATKVAQACVDFAQYAESYYFHDGEDQASLPVTIGYAASLAERGQASRQADVRLAATMLAHALEDLAAVLDQRFLRVGGNTSAVFHAYAADHGRPSAQD
ncbi:potassium channel family protein [Nonomuraea turcica]|uniref:potassium channel family protein n=1 Tax=Nonomuraea sp. G32 TaxID=3067274 RepID=UPI00273C9715|nr:potassium channel family protein [Nonomuraea sp. G32]MDP4510518.1 potassium channel family protein [Nonomuraea sp. G32]